MNIALFSDIHGNLPALEAVLSDIRSQRVEAVYCLGDLVGYAPFPNEVTDRVRREDIPTIMGNYDDGVGFERDECGCAYREPTEKRLGDRSLAWTKAHTTPENKAFLRTLHHQIRFEANGKRVLLVQTITSAFDEAASRWKLDRGRFSNRYSFIRVCECHGPSSW